MTFVYIVFLVHHKIEDLNVEFAWQRVRLFDEVFCRILYERCQENPTATVLNVTKKPKSKWRPVPLDTIVSNLVVFFFYNIWFVCKLLVNLKF